MVVVNVGIARWHSTYAGLGWPFEESTYSGLLEESYRCEAGEKHVAEMAKFSSKAVQVFVIAGRNIFDF